MRLKTLNGAPLCEHLNFNEAALLDPDEQDVALWPVFEPQSSAAAVKWRSLNPKDTRLHSGWSQLGQSRNSLHGDTSDVSFSIPNIEDSMVSFQQDTTNIDTTIALDEFASASDDFLCHSIVFHDTLLSSQIARDVDKDRSVSSSSFLTSSFVSTTSKLDTPSKIESHSTIGAQLPPKMAISPLGSLPSAQHLRSIYPQTPTPTLLAVVTAPLESRQVLVRKGGYRMNLHEVTVADDTMAGFRISFWGRPNREKTREQGVLIETLYQIQVGDILLLRNIALSIFRDKVYGQSLNPSISRARTTVHVLMQSDGISASLLGALPEPVAEHFLRVKKWARAHIAPDDTRSRKRPAPSVTRNQSKKRVIESFGQYGQALPPDTLEAV